MANEYIAIKDEKDEMGIVAITRQVFESIAGLSVSEESIFELPESTPFYHPVSCKVNHKEFSVSLDVKIRFGSNVVSECSKLQEKIHSAIAQMTDLNCRNIDIRVIGFLF
ncbi:MAG: Asp23/Gls24 family envelope stress response protein [Erysipelotrichaceae bacterium]|jgi:uncharacterized alkaline shock family protein YloU|nr:Asp23/Gls24 family envelope stress response protein [Erysipelotrichaceae bacterium]